MRSLRFILLFLFVVVAVGCSLLGKEKHHGATLADLEPAQQPSSRKAPSNIDRKTTIASYQALLGVIENKELRAIVTHRLADLNMLSSEDAQLATKNAEKESGQYFQLAISAYESLLKEYPNHPAKNEILYQLAKAYDLAGNPEKALYHLTLLVAIEPKSKNYVEAQFRRGEIFFNGHQYAEAEQAYSAAVNNGKDSPYFTHAMYMTGWSQYKRSHSEHSLMTFIRVCDHYLGTNNATPNLERADKELLNDALRVMSVQLADTDGGVSIEELFGKVGHRVYEERLYDSLASYLVAKQRYKDAADTYRAFLRQYPVHDKAPAIHENIIAVYIDGKFPSLVIPEKETYVQTYGIKSAYRKQHASDALATYAPRLQEYLLELAHYYHAKAQDSHNVADYQHAADWYDELLATAPASADAPKTAFMLGETLFEAKRYPAAIAAYETSAYTYPAHSQSAEAGYAALLAYDAQEKILSNKDAAKWKIKKLTSMQRFASTFKNDRRSTQILTQTATQYLAEKNSVAAIASAEGLLASSMATRDEKQIAYAVKANALFDEGLFADAEPVFLSAINNAPAASPRTAELRERLAACIYKQGEQQQAKADKPGAIAQFLRVSQVAPKTQIEANAIYDAATLSLELKDWKKAINSLEKFRAQFPKHPLSNNIPAKLALAYQENGQLANAAAAFEQLSLADGKPGDQRASLFHAAALYEKSKDYRKAIRAYENYVQHYPHPYPEAAEARAKLALVNEQLGDKTATIRWQQEIVRAEQKNSGQQTPRTRTLAAQSAFALAERQRIAFETIALTLPLDRSLKAKNSALNAALAAYGAASHFAIQEYVTGSAYRIAEIYAHFSHALMASQRPKNLADLELEQYNVLLEEQSYPFEEKAIDLHLLNTAKAKDNVYDEWVKSSYAALVKLAPGRFAKTEHVPDVYHALQ